MAFRLPNGKAPSIEIEISAVDFEILGNLIYFKHCIESLGYQREGLDAVHVLIEEMDYDYDEILSLVSYLQENAVPISSIKVGPLSDLVAEYDTRENLLTVGSKPPSTHDYTGIVHIWARDIEHQCNRGSLSELWPIKHRQNQITEFSRQFSLGD